MYLHLTGLLESLALCSTPHCLGFLCGDLLTLSFIAFPAFVLYINLDMFFFFRCSMISCFHTYIGISENIFIQQINTGSYSLYFKYLAFKAVILIFFKSNIPLNWKCYTHCWLNTHIFSYNIFMPKLWNWSPFVCPSIPSTACCFNYCSLFRHLIPVRNTFPTCHLCFFLFLMLLKKKKHYIWIILIFKLKCIITSFSHITIISTWYFN